MWHSVELCGSLGPDRFSCDLPKLGAEGLHILSADPLCCPVGLGMDGCSWLIETVFLCDEASSETFLAAILFSDVVPVNIQNNEREVSIEDGLLLLQETALSQYYCIKL